MEFSTQSVEQRIEPELRFTIPLVSGRTQNKSLAKRVETKSAQED